MKNLKQIVGILFIFASLASYAQNIEAIGQVNQCVDIYNAEIHKINDLTSDFNIWVTTDNSKVPAERIRIGKVKVSAITNQLISAMGKVETMPSVQGSSQLRDTIRYVFDQYLNLHEGSEMLVVLNYDPTTGVDELIEFHKNFATIERRSDRFVDIINAEIEKAQLKYGADRIVEDRHQAKTDRINALTDYINSFAASSAIMTKYYNQAIEAISAGNDSLGRRTVLSMKKYSAFHLPRLEKIEGFKGNRALIDAVVDKAKFLSGSGFELLKTMVKNKAIVDGYDQENGTREDYDKYSAAADAFNQANNKVANRMNVIINACNGNLIALVNAHYN